MAPDPAAKPPRKKARAGAEDASIPAVNASEKAAPRQTSIFEAFARKTAAGARGAGGSATAQRGAGSKQVGTGTIAAKVGDPTVAPATGPPVPPPGNEAAALSAKALTLPGSVGMAEEEVAPESPPASRLGEVSAPPPTKSATSEKEMVAPLCGDATTVETALFSPQNEAALSKVAVSDAEMTLPPSGDAATTVETVSFSPQKEAAVGKAAMSEEEMAAPSRDQAKTVDTAIFPPQKDATVEEIEDEDAIAVSPSTEVPAFDPPPTSSGGLALWAEAAQRCRNEWQPLLGEGWFVAIEPELRRPSFLQVLRDVENLRSKHGNYVIPTADLVFRAFQATPFEEVRVVILGVGPPASRKQASGLAFSVPRGVHVPPTLKNILREAYAWPASHGDLSNWARQGVLLLNSLLTTMEAEKPDSHKSVGWERITDAAIRSLNREKEGVVFLLWGDEAQAKGKMIDSSRHQVFTAGLPSPLSYERSFKGCGHFFKVNEFLVARGGESAQIDWGLPP
eukprot:TRINITY_DN20141_c0_g1_i1.p1 TRINITY_DN20141_c0_g1~~TRINITY_DN20141_c0_g1_i1.p1  ORF type:complete len:509 (+),score=123.85 TRINITY_DN20141_c0_g1_i1:45-1571(+)